MSYQEKRSITSILTSAIVLTIYSVIMYQRFQNGVGETENMIKFWATFIVLLVPFSILARIVVTIFFHISNEVVSTVKGEEAEKIDFVDERDKIIEIKAMRSSLVVFMIAFIAAMLTQVFDMEVSAMFIVLIAGGFLSEVLGGVFEIYYYRKGV